MRQRIEVQRFADVMEQKLSQNDHKGHWSECSTGAMLRRIGDELRELRRAIQRKDSVAVVAEEAADVANFCLMTAENYWRDELGDYIRPGMRFPKREDPSKSGGAA